MDSGDRATFAEKVLAIIKKIPKGKVLTYGQVATIAGVPHAARIVGGILYQKGPDEKIPWQRVINSQGKISTYRVGMGEAQRSSLEREGLKFNSEGAVDLRAYQWWPSEKQLEKFRVDEEIAYRISQKISFR